MSVITFSLTLLSDAEIGSGLGGETVNDIVARDHRNQPVLRASHIKGLLRAGIERITTNLGWEETLEDLVFGRGGEEGSDGLLGAIIVRDAMPDEAVTVRTITRTAVSELGVVQGTTLRTTEAVPAGTEFRGEIRIPSGAVPAVDLAVRLGLLALGAVGGNRNRGSGACRVRIEGETRWPGTLLKLLAEEIRAGLRPPQPHSISSSASRDPDGPEVLFRMTFTPNGPFCCPETPVVRNNLLRAGFGIPASAVLGAVISRIAEATPALAGAAFEDPRTRAWPLLPCAMPGTPGPYPIPVRVSLSHRMSKLPTAGGHSFRDAAIEAYDWRTAPAGAPLKGADGVLLRGTDAVRLWRSGDMPRVITAHAVHHDPSGQGLRNLFTVEALAPMVCTGWMCLPARAARKFQELIDADPAVAFGKARTIRGGGSLKAEPVEWETLTSGHGTVFVLQSPAAIPDNWTIGRAEEALTRLVRESGWGDVEDLEPEQGQIRVTTQAACAVRFGWNRHGLGNHVADTRRLRARRVFLPGSVFVLKEAPSNLAELLLRGLGVSTTSGTDGRSQGYGAVLPHPGIAQLLFSEQPLPEELSSSPAGRLAADWFSRAPDCSASQVSRVAGLVRNGDGQAAIAYLEKQRTGRSSRYWDRWSPVFDAVKQALQSNADSAQAALRTWQDLAVINRGNSGGEEDTHV